MHKNLRNANRVDYYQLHVFGEKDISHSNVFRIYHMHSSLPFLGYNNLIVRFVEVNEHFWCLQVINYSVAYIHY
jgi:hypothetical protein